jgi:hypothetical protein
VVDYPPDHDDRKAIEEAGVGDRYNVVPDLNCGVAEGEEEEENDRRNTRILLTLLASSKM